MFPPFVKDRFFTPACAPDSAFPDALHKKDGTLMEIPFP